MLFMLMPYMRQGYDLESDPVYQNLDSNTGLLKALSLVLRLLPQGLFFGGVPCDSFGWMSGPTHCRSALEPFGATKRAFVYRGNILCTRFCMLALLGICRGVVWALENPLRTAIQHMPPLQFILRPEFRCMMVTWFQPQIWCELRM